jgi:hypothetical protein
VPRARRVVLAAAVKLGGGGEKSVSGGGAILIADGVPLGPCQPVLARIGLGVESERHERPHSPNCVVPMA